MNNTGSNKASHHETEHSDSTLSEEMECSPSQGDSPHTVTINGVDLHTLVIDQLPEGHFVLAMDPSDDASVDWSSAKFCGKPYVTCNGLEHYSPTRGFGDSLDLGCAYCWHVQNTFMPVLFSTGYPWMNHNLIHWGDHTEKEHHAYIIGPMAFVHLNDVLCRVEAHTKSNVITHIYYQPSVLELMSSDDDEDHSDDGLEKRSPPPALCSPDADKEN